MGLRSGSAGHMYTIYGYNTSGSKVNYIDPADALKTSESYSTKFGNAVAAVMIIYD